MNYFIFPELVTYESYAFFPLILPPFGSTITKKRKEMMNQLKLSCKTEFRAREWK